MCIDDPELIAEFVTEAGESLADIENQLLAIESDGANINLDLVNSVFRSVHSIKGVAGFMNWMKINHLAHSLEDVLNQIRNQELIPNSENVNVMLRAADQLSEMVSSPQTSNDIDVTQHLDALNALMNGNPTTTGTDGAVRSESEMADLAVETASLVRDIETGNTKDDVEAVSSPLAEPSNVSTEIATPLEPTKPVESSSAKANEKSTTTVETSIRVPVSTLDHLMNLAGESVLNRNRLLQYSCDKSDTQFAKLSSDIDHNTCELQEAIMQTRMQPIGTAFSRFPRIVRDLSSKLGKECQLVVEGKDVEVDKSIIEAIGDPLTHLIRNSVDHGVELPAARLQSGKNSLGTIRLSAYHRAGQVCIDIEDDGGGIDPEKLKEKAVSKGIISDRQALEMGTREALRLIFHPGFSTSEKLTDVSGRGVGMDVVRTNIERIGGTVEVESEIGKGTSIQIILPLTLAIIRSLIISSCDRRFAIPQVNVAELVRVSGKEHDTRIRKFNDAVVLRLRDALIPLVDLRKTLGLDGPQSGKKNELENDTPISEIPRAFNVVVLETGSSRYGVIVDELHDSEEIVVKPLGRHMKNCRSFAGATILGDGRVALILDVAGIADKAQVTSVDKSDFGHEQNEIVRDQDFLRLLLFRNAPDEQFAVSMAQVERIERFAISKIEKFNGRLVTQYRGGTLPLLSIEATISASPRRKSESEFISVIVLTCDDREYGVIAPQIEDICVVPLAIDTDSLSEPGVFGSQIIDGVTTRILDVSKIYQTCHPDLSVKTNAQRLADLDIPQTILVVEDSKFFRKRIVSLMEESDYLVFEAEDGVEAWDTLQKERSKIDLIVTDIEMPNMNGLQLCEKIRADGAFNDLPIIALTSLVSDKDIQRGMQCGMNDYQMKMARDKLLNSIHRLLNDK